MEKSNKKILDLQARKFCAENLDRLTHNGFFEPTEAVAIDFLCLILLMSPEDFSKIISEETKESLIKLALQTLYDHEAFFYELWEERRLSNAEFIIEQLRERG